MRIAPVAIALLAASCAADAGAGPEESGVTTPPSTAPATSPALVSSSSSSSSSTIGPITTDDTVVTAAPTVEPGAPSVADVEELFASDLATVIVDVYCCGGGRARTEVAVSIVGATGLVFSDQLVFDSSDREHPIEFVRAAVAPGEIEVTLEDVPAGTSCTETVEAAAGEAFTVRAVVDGGCFAAVEPTWFTVDGTRLRNHQLAEYQGPSHCDWEDVRFLNVDDGAERRSYARDPGGVFGPEWYGGPADVTDGTAPATPTSAAGAPRTFEVLDELPDAAFDTRLRSNGRLLWADPTLDYVFIVDGDSVERWPRIEPRPLCA